MDNKSGLLDTLLKTTQGEADTASGLSKYHSLLVKSPAEYKALDPQTFRYLKDQLPLLQGLPSAPKLAEYNFLLSKAASPLRELFEDTWNAASLAYAAAAETFLTTAQLADTPELKDSEEYQSLSKAARQGLLTASNTLARLLAQYRYLLERRALKSAATKPGNERESVFDEEDAKRLSTAIKTRNELQKLSQPRRRDKFYQRGNRYGRGNRNQHWRRNGGGTGGQRWRERQQREEYSQGQAQSRGTRSQSRPRS